MSDQKTTPTDASVLRFLETVSQQRRDEALMLVDMMREISGHDPVMWGASIIGFDSYHYVYKSGRAGDWPVIGFSPRKTKLSIYITNDAEQFRRRLDAMGTYAAGKGCIYINKLADVDLEKLHGIVRDAYLQAKAAENS